MWIVPSLKSDPFHPMHIGPSTKRTLGHPAAQRTYTLHPSMAIARARCRGWWHSVVGRTCVERAGKELLRHLRVRRGGAVRRRALFHAQDSADARRNAQHGRPRQAAERHALSRRERTLVSSTAFTANAPRRTWTLFVPSAGYVQFDGSDGTMSRTISLTLASSDVTVLSSSHTRRVARALLLGRRRRVLRVQPGRSARPGPASRGHAQP
jgi:hypothetical protein